MEIIVVLALIVVIIYVWAKFIIELREEKNKKEIRKKEEEKAKAKAEKEEVEKRIEKEITIMFESLKKALVFYEKKLNNIIQEYKELIETNEDIQKTVKKEQDYIKEAHESISALDSQKFFDIKQRLTEYGYILNQLEFSCIDFKYKKNLEEIIKNEPTAILDMEKRIIENAKGRREFVIKTRDSVLVLIDEFSYTNYMLYGYVKVVNNSLDKIKGIKILVKIYKNGIVVGTASVIKDIPLNPKEIFEQRIRFTTDTYSGDKFIIEDYEILY